MQVNLLRPPHGGCGQVLVHPGHKVDVLGLEKLARLPERIVEAAKRGAAVPGDKDAGIHSGSPVPLPQGQQQPDKRLRPRQEDTALLDGVLVV